MHLRNLVFQNRALVSKLLVVVAVMVFVLGATYCRIMVRPAVLQTMDLNPYVETMIFLSAAISYCFYLSWDIKKMQELAPAKNDWGTRSNWRDLLSMGLAICFSGIIVFIFILISAR